MGIIRKTHITRITADGKASKSKGRLKSRSKKSDKGNKLPELTVIAGKYKGTKLVAPDNGDITHPMGAREKNALMNMLEPYLKGARVFDVCAGSGQLGIEALSRGARSASFLENDEDALIALTKNCKRIGYRPPIFPMPPFDIVIVDPPYDKFEEILPPNLGDALIWGGVLALSHPSSFDPESITDLTYIKTSSYANCNISLYQK